MHKSIAAITFFVSIIIGCRQSLPKNNDFIIIQGNVKNIPDGKVYLTEAHRWHILLDSTICKNGDFVFKIPNDSSFIPYMASIYFIDSSWAYKKAPLVFLNYIRSGDTPKYFNTAFYLENGLTRLEGDMKAKEKVRAYAGKETDLMFRFDGDFGYLGNADSTLRRKNVSNFEKVIGQSPKSYFLLQGIVENKEQYTAAEIQKILYLFAGELQNSRIGNTIKDYITLSSGINGHENVSLSGLGHQPVQLIDASAGINMIVFWASWCGPCRMEIPQLKLINNKFKAKGLRVLSVSIDEDAEAWKGALIKEKMPWEQALLSKNSDIEKVRAIYRFSSIPVVIFADKKGHVIKKFTGYSPNNFRDYETLISGIVESK